MLKLKTGVVTKTHVGCGTYIFDNLRSQTLFIPVDVSPFFAHLAEGSSSIQQLADSLCNELDCSIEDALLASQNTINSLIEKQLLEN